MPISVDMGLDPYGKSATLNLEELLATRLLVQGNSGSGKSHLLRRLLEKSAGQVQQVIVDPEGEFTTLADKYGHVVVEGAAHSETEIGKLAMRIREHRLSVVLSLEGLEADGQMRCAANFLNTLFDAPRDMWFPALVIVDEAQMFAPTAGGEVPEDVRRASLGAMTNLMCRGRKRGLAGIIATQRLAKLAKNVAAEASNFLMGRTFLDIDMARAADLLGMERRQAEAIRDLERGQFLGLGPAISRRPIKVKIGTVETGPKDATPQLTPLPTATGEEAASLLFDDLADAPEPPKPEKAAPKPLPSETMMEQLAAAVTTRRAADEPPVPAPDAEEVEPIIAEALGAMVEEEDGKPRSTPIAYQDFSVRCRMKGLRTPPLDLPAFGRRLAAARAGIPEDPQPDWGEVLAAAEALPDDMLAPFLLIAKAARDGAPSPTEDQIAAIYGTASLSRARRLIDYIEERELIVKRTDMGGKTSITLPALGWTTAAA
ncbi:ATP-binding protein [Sphingomicrobium aestuariivivum]|uniref:ATP-binding protein n=1 Tax=Sphingomicrobium aestuariivivum TaxID=1582356 RepID=UPI001FD64B8A|nr:ATP-binding protein [Sphingomicrobium aestuariivivum]MCJ8191095.1 ATP-binding protein [Sphingomicrobium aestuariivivum]